MKRYNLIAIDNNTGHVIRNYKLMPIESFEGEWVRCSDVVNKTEDNNTIKGDENVQT